MSDDFIIELKNAHIYFDANSDKFGHWSVKLTDIPGDIVSFIREKEQNLWNKYRKRDEKNNYTGGIIKSCLLERDNYKLMIDCRLEDSLIYDQNGIPLKWGEIMGGNKCNVKLRVKENKYYRQINYRFYIEELIVFITPKNK